MAKNKSYDTADMLNGFMPKPKTEEKKIEKPEPVIERPVESPVKTETIDKKNSHEPKESIKKTETRASTAQKTEKQSIPTFAAPVKENKSKPISLLVKPSLHEKAKKKCKEEGLAFNELINQFLEWYIK